MQCAAQAAERRHSSSSCEQRDAAAALLAAVSDAAVAPCVWRHVLSRSSSQHCDGFWPAPVATGHLQPPACSTDVLSRLAAEGLRSAGACARQLAAGPSQHNAQALVQRTLPDLRLLLSLARQGSLANLEERDAAALCVLVRAVLEQRAAAVTAQARGGDDAAVSGEEGGEACEHALHAMLNVLLLLVRRSDATSQHVCARIIDSSVIEALTRLPADASSAAFWDVLAHRARESPEATAVLCQHVHNALGATTPTYELPPSSAL